MTPSPRLELCCHPKFRWKTMDGQVLTLAQMETSHIFNSMKMVFNHLAQAHGGQPVWFIKRYSDYKQAANKSPEQLAWLVVIFIKEIERRKDLPTKYKIPYLQILEQLRPRLIESDKLLLPMGD